ncbi:MAG: YicC family protein [Ruminococcaceae bacterium]|nr:YicC family protein [Oscillospiraceae bacterium]
MIKSMTGFGRAEQLFEAYKISVEIKSVNNRYLDINTKVYKQYSFLEEVVRECVSAGLSRGKVDVFVQIEPVGEEEIAVTLNDGVVKGYRDALSRLVEVADVPDDIAASSFLRLPDVFKIEKQENDKDEIASDARIVTNQAIADLIENRSREGERLKSFFDQCIVSVKTILETIKDRSPLTVDEHKQKMKERIEELLGGIEVDEARLLTEIGIFADKVNITEEIVRFESHLKEYSHLLESDIAVGRKLDFITQELNREANTMGSKCNDYIISKSVVELKSEIEKLREQVQNIE